MPIPVRIKPPALRPGDLVGVVAPAAAVEPEFLARGVQALQSRGYRVKVSEHALARDRILAGPDAIRAAELMRFFADPEVRAIFAARGGYGTGRILPMLDYQAIAAQPKIVVGFSDSTFLLNALLDKSGLLCFHGPMVAVGTAKAAEPPPAAADHARQLLAGELASFELPAQQVLVEGIAEGELTGGCLSIMTAMLATPYAPRWAGKVVFLEDVGEKPYRIDRMLVQLKQAGLLQAAAGLVFGGINGPENSAAERAAILDFVREQTAGLEIPVLWGIEAGHQTQNFLLPLGARARIDTQSATLTILEKPVQNPLEARA